MPQAMVGVMLAAAAVLFDGAEGLNALSSSRISRP